jgi:alkylated DNA repair dioxygenase AlkB
MKSNQRRQQQSQRSLTSFFKSSSSSITSKINRSPCHDEPERNCSNRQVDADTTYYKRQKLLIRNSGAGSHFQKCPLCDKSFPLHQIERHASYCNGICTSITTTNSDEIHQFNNESSLLSPGDDRIMTNDNNMTVPNDNKTELERGTSDNILMTHSTFIRKVREQPLSTGTRTYEKRVLVEADEIIFLEPVPGLYVIENFISEEEEQQIINELDGKSNVETFLPWKDSNFNGRHQYKRWGVHCDLRSRRVSEAENPLPDFMNTILVPKLLQLLRTLRRKQHIKPYSRIVSNDGSWIPNEANAINYQRHNGDELHAHVDDRKLSKEIIANLSLAGTCYMTFTNVNSPSHHQKQQSISGHPDKVKVLLNPRCLQLLTGLSRYNYTHSIDHDDLLSDRRISVTMRQSPLSQPNHEVLLSHFISRKEANNNSGNPECTREVSNNNIQKSNSIKESITIRGSSVQKEINQSSCVINKKWWKREVSILKDRSFKQPLPGLYIFDDFISKDEEDQIIQQIENTNFPPHWTIERHTGLHREKRYGVDHDMWSPILRNPKYPLPNFMESILIPKLKTKTIPTLHDFQPNDINIIEYQRKYGHWLSQHVDDRSKHKEPIANISLTGDCYMTFNNKNYKKNNLPVETQRILLKQRTLFIMTGNVRYDFSHGIEKNDLLSDRRVSVTMRQTKKLPSEP